MASFTDALVFACLGPRWKSASSIISFADFIERDPELLSCAQLNGSLAFLMHNHLVEKKGRRFRLTEAGQARFTRPAKLDYEGIKELLADMKRAGLQAPDNPPALFTFAQYQRMVKLHKCFTPILFFMTGIVAAPFLLVWSLLGQVVSPIRGRR